MAVEGNFIPGMAAGAQALNAGTGLFSMIYNAANQQRAWAREDTAVQRRTADLRAAGLSPTLAAGSAAQSSGPIQMKGTNLQAGALEAASLAKSKKKTESWSRDMMKTQARLLREQTGKVTQDKYTAERQASMAANALIRDDALMAWANENNLNPAMVSTPMGQAKMQLDLMKDLDAADQAMLLALLAAQGYQKIK